MPDNTPLIVHYFPRIRLNEGGVVRALVDLCDAIVRAGCPVTLMTADSADVDRVWPEKPSLLTVHALERPLGAFGSIPSAASEAIARCDVLHLHTPWDRGNLALAREARRRGVPYIISTHGMLNEWCMRQRRLKKRAYIALAGRRLIERSAMLHYTTQAEFDQSRRWTPHASSVVIPLVFDLDDYTNLPGPGLARQRWPEIFSPGRPSFLFLGRVHPQKGPDYLIEAVARLHELGVDATAVIAGPGHANYIQSLRELAAARGIENHIVFPGMVTGVEKVSLYQAVDLFVLPTFTESFGFVFFEALAAKTPVITTRGVDTRAELESSGGAVLTDRDPAQIASAIERLLADPAKLIQMGEAGRAWTLDRFAPGKVVREYVDLYQRVARCGEPS